ncbi:methylenetetrahydrofolate reductase (NADPH) [Roseinatronobacter thiooxidans]|uniref:Methylenetetrahydrofolate reductase (NADPH) n=1 Tax=Roseinatronobacter thiooxidans TaxID=121821 RepID=A0A2W7QE39_9RHOB|nr:5,10-methylenetetrahydrofolate reductase [Roseinatronobacter thiooxidans]PZX46774.1 methylenetetrahydrofolate reductase (NADPH) [Roseinatronobacter thiooxidans]
MSLLNFRRTSPASAPHNAQLVALMQGHSIEVMPRTAEKIADFRTVLPAGTRVYIAHIDGTPIADMVATAARLRAQGMEPMPHFPARIIANRAELADWVARYQGEADIREALMLGGGVTTPKGAFDNSMQLLETGLFDGFRRLHVAGHPEGNRDIAPDGGHDIILNALRWKQDFARAKGIEMAIVTQFAFEAEPIIDWAQGLRRNGIDLPVHLGVAGPAKLQTLIKFAIACGVGPSLKVLQKRAKDVSKLLLPFEPSELVTDLAAHKAANPDFAIERLHFFPLGGIKAATDWTIAHGGPSSQPAVQP